MIELKVDPRNPGEIFACYGLFELAELAAPGGVGKFQEDTSWKFKLNTSVTLADCIEELQKMKVNKIDESKFLDGRKASWDINWEGWAPVVLETRWGNIPLNWWRVPTFERETGFKFWAGNVSPYHLLDEIKKELHLVSEDDPFRPVGLKTCFGFDARFSWSRRDVGYSLDHPRVRVSVSPFAEILSAIALQTFRPRLSNDGVEYYLWMVELPIIVARVACSGSIPKCVGYVSRKIQRGKYKALNWAVKIT